MERDTDSQPNWNEDAAARVDALTTRTVSPLARARLRRSLGVQRRGRFVHLRVAKQWGGGSLDEIFPQCPRCNKTWPRAHVNPFFTAIMGVPIYTQFITCEDCLTAVNAAAASQHYEARLRVLGEHGFTQVQKQWTFDTYPNQGSPWLRRARQYVQHPAHDILIYGNPGVGKTGLAIAILRALWNDGKNVRAIRASELILSLRGTDAQHTQALLRDLSQADFLLLDDLSAIKRTEFWEEILNVLIDIRQQDNRITILTANVHVGKSDPSSVLSEFFGYVAYDRLVERGEFWQMKGTSGRQAYTPQTTPGREYRPYAE